MLTRIGEEGLPGRTGLMAAPSTSNPVVMICGDDEFSDASAGPADLGPKGAEDSGMDQEVIEAAAGTVDGRSGASPRFGKRSRPCRFGDEVDPDSAIALFLGEDCTSQSAAVTSAARPSCGRTQGIPVGWRPTADLGGQGGQTKDFQTLDKIGTVEVRPPCRREGLGGSHRTRRCGNFERRERRSPTMPSRVEVGRVGPNLRALSNEVEKLLLHLGDRGQVTLREVEVLPLQKMAAGLPLGDAVGDRNLPQARASWTRSRG